MPLMFGGRSVKLRGKATAGIILIAILFFLTMFSFSEFNKHIIGEASVKPSKNWGMFFNTIGGLRIDITEPGVAVKINVPREFLQGRGENDTSFVFSDISNDYYYYNVTDQSLHYPYNENAPYSIVIWNPPLYSPPDCVGRFYNFTPPKFVLLEELDAPDISGIYNFSVFIAKKLRVDEWGQLTPDFPGTPDKVLQVPVSMREDPGHIYGHIWDGGINGPITAKGIVYAIEENTGAIGRAYVDASTGFFNITGLYEGTYRLEGSAGFFPTTGFAYAPTVMTSVPVNRGSGTGVGEFILNRGVIMNGTIEYVDEFNNPIRPLETPYFKQLRTSKQLNLERLNFTVEVYDEGGRIVASKTYLSQNTTRESFSLTVRNGVKHVSYPALGSEFSGFGEGKYTIRVWVCGFIQPEGEVASVEVPSYNGYTGITVTASMIHMPYGGMVTGKINLFNGLTHTLETPREGEYITLGTRSGTRFGGNILVELYNEEGAMKGLAILNRTMVNGTSTFSDFSSGDDTDLLRFHILGFSDFLNNTYKGVWRIGSIPGPSPWDYGLEPGTYFIKIWVNGYLLEEADPTSIILSERGSAVGNASVTLNMIRGGAVEVTVESSTTRPGTRLPQAAISWRFLDLCPPPYLRIYIYNETGVPIGYAERQLKLGVTGVASETVTLNFTGDNWPLYKVIYYGFLPSWMDEGRYEIKAFTCGYVQTWIIEVYVHISSLTGTGFQIQLGGKIYGTTPLMSDNLFVSIPENATVEAWILLEGELAGVDVKNLASGSSTFTFSTYGFLGRGHFFYVDREGSRWHDYGLDVGNYTVFIPEFRRTGSGQERIFFQESEVQANLPELDMEVGVYFHLERMIKVYGTVYGEVSFGTPSTLPLVWVKASSDTRVGYSYDGDYSLHIPPPPPGEVRDVTLTFTIPGYEVHTHLITVTRGVDAVGYIPPPLTQSGEPFP